MDFSPGSSPDTKSQKSEKFEKIEKFEFKENKEIILKLLENLKLPLNLTETINNFERVFFDFINENYNTFTEKDLQSLIELHLRRNLTFKKCDPFKIEEII